MNLSELIKETDATYHGADVPFSGLSTDTRSIKSGDVFAALKGPNFNGEEFVAEAISKGASAIIVSRAFDDIETPQVVCTDTTVLLAQLARAYRNKMTNSVIAVTGSCGKTSVKGMLHSILSLHGKVSVTAGNFNNHIGVPLTILNADTGANYWVIEAGTNSPGEIRFLSDIIQPDIAAVTNVQKTHIEGFGSVEAIADEKSGLFSPSEVEPKKVFSAACAQYAPFKALLNAKDAIVIGGVENYSLSENMLTYDRAILDERGCAGFHLALPNKKTIKIQLTVPGAHQQQNASIAAAVAYIEGIPESLIIQGLAAYSGEKGRMNLHDWNGGKLIDDTYNASPHSMKAAIDYLSLSENSFLLLGDMGELGSFAKDEHRAIGKYANDKKIKCLCALGEYADEYIGAYEQGEFKGIAKKFSTVDELSEYVASNARRGASVLVKGSRYTRMDRVCTKLLEGKH